MSLNFLKSSGEKMLIEHKRFRDIEHPGVKGDLHEDSLSQVLKQYLPQKYGVATGFIVDAKGAQTKQQDIIIYDISTCPVFLHQGETRVIPVESVYATIEVKTSLDSTVLSDACANIASVKDMHRTSDEGILSIPLGFVFAYSSSTKIETLCQRLIAINKSRPREKRVNGIFILDRGIIVYFGKYGFNNISVRPLEGYFEGSMAGEEGENYINFYLCLLSGLKNQIVSFPNIMQYAINDGYLNTPRDIGEQEMPEDAFYYSPEGKRIFLHTMEEYRKKED
ncbi:hypothetical protein GTY48_04915 [Bacillus thuringiensis]|uniref:DUF6602 domain-containing protein n=1 Tax=Bacillus thuringiensis TaxID=1428 RepID=UPI0013689617|nr:DUF6602 domain-containing protein [Bacillus thuringiensis]MYW23030.1 hypothetical protein [Bacillus thuringiensis]